MTPVAKDPVAKSDKEPSDVRVSHATLSAALDKPLAADRIKKRQGGGGQSALSYLETHDVIRTANAIFGFGKWGHEIIELRPIAPVVVHNSDQKAGMHVGYVCVIRLTVEGCIPTSGVGYGDATEYRESASVTAHELAAKEAESDAIKRALKNYGDQFGLALYDKQAASAGHVTAGNGRQEATGGRVRATHPPDSPQATPEALAAYKAEVEAADLLWEPVLQKIKDYGGTEADLARSRSAFLDHLATLEAAAAA